MLTKYIELGAYDEEGSPRVQLLHAPGLSKVAEAHPQLRTSKLHPAVEKFAATVRPTPKGAYILLNAMGATEYWGQNVNGDIFYEKHLHHAPPGWDSFSPLEMAQAGATWKYGYPTFLKARYYLKHRNKGPSAVPLGDVHVAVWNKKMHRVELVVFIDRQLCHVAGAPEVIERVDRGESPFVSMGCNVPFDVCTVCHNKAKTTADYCAHIRHQRGEILPNGVQVGMINIDPSFFDISDVTRGADRTARMLWKIAQEGGAGKLAQEKEGEIEKQVAPQPSSRGQALAAAAEAKESPLPEDVLRALSKEPLDVALASTARCGIVLRPEEFQRLVLEDAGHGSLARLLAAHGHRFPETDEFEDFPLDPASASEALLHLLVRRGLLESRSFAAPAIRRRILIRVEATPSIPSMEIDSPMLRKIAAAYNGYRKGLLKEAMSITHSLSSHPLLADRLYGDRLVEAFTGLPWMEKRSEAGLVPESAAYLAGAHYNNRDLLSSTVECQRVLALVNR